MRKFLLSISVVLALVGVTAGVAIAAGPSTPLTASNGGRFTCIQNGTATSADGSECTSDGMGLYKIPHGLGVDPATIQVTLDEPYFGYYDIVAHDDTSFTVKVRSARDYRSVYHGPLAGEWLASK